MIYAYIRVSSNKQSIENQRYEINCFCKKNGVKVEKWIEETASGTKRAEDRELGEFLGKMQKDDILICSELSRLGRNLLMIMAILNDCMNKNIQIWTTKENYRLGNDINSKVLAFAFGLSAEIERNLISQRTKEALLKRKDEGKKLGRPKGVRNKELKLAKYEKEIKKLVEQKTSRAKIAKHFNVSQTTLKLFFDRNL